MRVWRGTLASPRRGMPWSGRGRMATSSDLEDAMALTQVLETYDLLSSARVSGAAVAAN